MPSLQSKARVRFRPKADKLHSARVIVQDLGDPDTGEAVFDRFEGGKAGTLGYDEAIVQILTRRQAPMAPALDSIVSKMHEFSASSSRQPLVAWLQEV